MSKWQCLFVEAAVMGTGIALLSAGFAVAGTVLTIAGAVTALLEVGV